MQRYLETRTITQATAIGADIARHLLSRQYVGRAVIVCDRPTSTISVMRKHWMRLSRGLQKERASTLNAEKILQLTSDITRMQHMVFTIKTPAESPRADVFFIAPDNATDLPTGCYSLYLLDKLSTKSLLAVVKQLPDNGLVVDYCSTSQPAHELLLPKRQLEQQLPRLWQALDKLMRQHNIDPRRIAPTAGYGTATDEAIDVLLGISTEFTRAADEFLRQLRLAQPVAIPNSQQQLYDLVATLNRRVSALSPSITDEQFVSALGGDDSALHDVGTENLAFEWSLAACMA